MTDPDIASKTYIEPLTLKLFLRSFQEKPDAILLIMGGQTALNLARTIRVRFLKHNNVELIEGFNSY